jgi:hypothetical protein
MSAAAVGKEQDALASGAKPRPEGRVRERGWRPTHAPFGVTDTASEAARRRAIEAADAPTSHTALLEQGGRG